MKTLYQTQWGMATVLATGIASAVGKAQGAFIDSIYSLLNVIDEFC
jgi:hypothetical protein